MDLNPLLKRDDNTCESDEEYFKNRFKRLCKSDINSDCEFLIGSEVIKGHKLIFSLASQVFYDMFYGNLKENSVFEVCDVSCKGFSIMKQFIYTGEVNFKEYNLCASVFAVSTYEAAKMYNIPELVMKCIRFIEEEIDSDPSLAIKRYWKYNKIMTELNEICRKAIEKLTYEIFNTSSERFFATSEIWDWILSFESLALSSELELFNYFEKWALAKTKKHKKIAADEIGSSFNNLKKQIRFLTMDAKEFAVAAKSPLLTNEEKLAIALNMAEFGSIPYPDNLSANRKKRDFTGKKNDI